MFVATAVAVALMVVLDRMYRKPPMEPQRAYAMKNNRGNG
jgi:hypothetical protein